MDDYPIQFFRIQQFIHEFSPYMGLAGGGLVSGVLAGFLGIGGGTVLVPLLVSLGCTPVESVATSSFVILITSISGSVQNWRMGYFDLKRVIYLGFPALVTAQIGVYFASRIEPYLLLFGFGLLLCSTIYLVELRKRLTLKQISNELQPEEVSNEPQPQEVSNEPQQFSLFLSRIGTGSAAGILSGLFGVGGGVIMVPLQILLLGESLKLAIQTSLGVIVITALSACIGHAINGNVLFIEGIILGIGGFLGAQISTRILPKSPDEIVSLAFRSMLGILSIYIFWLAWITYSEPAI